MLTTCRPLTVDRLTELVSILGDTQENQARSAVEDALSQSGPWSDNLYSVAHALVMVREGTR